MADQAPIDPAAKLATDITLERAKAVIQFALAAIQGVILVNGGAAVAILAFLGNVWPKATDGASMHTLATAIRGPLTLFLIGVSAGVLTACLAYLTQLALTNGYRRVGNTLRVAAIVSVLSGVAAFFAGSLGAASVFAQSFGDAGAAPAAGPGSAATAPIAPKESSAPGSGNAPNAH